VIPDGSPWTAVEAGDFLIVGKNAANIEIVLDIVETVAAAMKRAASPKRSPRRHHDRWANPRRRRARRIVGKTVIDIVKTVNAHFEDAAVEIVVIVLVQIVEVEVIGARYVRVVRSGPEIP